MRQDKQSRSVPGFLIGWLVSISLVLVCLPAGHSQERSSVATQAAAQPQGKLPVSPGIQAHIVPQGRTASRPVDVQGPFREGAHSMTPRVAGPQIEEDVKWPRGFVPAVSGGPRINSPNAPAAPAPPVAQTTRSVAEATAAQRGAPGAPRTPAAPLRPLAPAGRSVIEALAAQQSHPGDQITARSDAFGESLLLGLRSPALTTLWPDTVSGGQDPQLAVSRTTVAVLTWSALTFYDKSGKPLPSTATFLNPTDMPTLFADTLVAVNASLNLNPAVAGNPDFQMCHHETKCDSGNACDASNLCASGQCHDNWMCQDVGDARIVFDAIHKRWVVVATAKNDPPDKSKYSSIVVKTQRRTKFLLAVSRDEDPSKGFNTYFFNAGPDDGACNWLQEVQCPNSSFTPGNASDYPSVGVSDTHYMFTVHADHGADSWGYLVTVNAQDVMNGLSQPHAHAFWGWDVGGGDAASFVTMPVVNQEKMSPVDQGLIVDTHNDKLSVTSVSNSDPPVLTSAYWDMPDQQAPPDWQQKGSMLRINDGNVGTKPITAIELNNTLVAAFNDCRKWVDSQDGCSPSIHIVSADVSLFPFSATLHIDRVIGWRSLLDDPADDIVAYGLPGIAVNKDSDIAVVYTRTSPMLYSEARYSTWLHGELDVRPSNTLKPGGGPIPANFADCLCLAEGNCPKNTCGEPHPDTAGVAVDPFDRTGVWMAHVYANSSGGFSTAVGKIFGKAHPDLSILQLDFSPKTAKVGDFIQVQYTLHNGGDGLAGGIRSTARLVPLATTMARPEIWIGEDEVSNLASGSSVNRTFPVKLAADVPPGSYAIEVQVQMRDPNMTEYSTDDNTAQAGVLVVGP